MPEDDDLGDETLEDADEAWLDSLLKPRTTTVGYVYDFGDNWELRLTLTNRRISAHNTAYPRYIGGERNAPPEACGGVPAFTQLLHSMSDPGHPVHADMHDWVGVNSPAFVAAPAIRAGWAVLWSFRATFRP